PLQMDVLATKHLLVGIIGIVGRHRPGVHLTCVDERERIAVEPLEERQHLRVAHEACFSLQVMQTRVHGMALRRASAIGSPQSRQMPYVPFSIFHKASSMACKIFASVCLSLS